MAQQRTKTQSRPTARTRTRARQQRERERTSAFAVTLSITTIFVVAVTSVIVMSNVPGTAFFDLFQGMLAHTISPSGELYGQFLSRVEYQDDLIFTPLSLLLGGVALGRLISPRFSALRLLRIAAAASSSVLAACLLFRWGLILIGQHGHLRTGEVTGQLVITQLVCLLGWIVAYLLGTWLGVLWRDHRRSGRPNTPAISNIPAA